MKALKERLKKPGEDVTDQWADRNASESASLIKNEANVTEASNSMEPNQVESAEEQQA